MMAELIDRKQLKADVRELLSASQVSPRVMAALYLGLSVLLSVVDYLAGGGNALLDRNLPGIFVYVLTSLLTSVLSAGFVLYCMAVRRGERAEYLTLFDGFSFVGKIVLLQIITVFFVFLWSLLFLIPGIIALYRYRFAFFNLYENPGIGVMEALDMSKRQTLGYKSQLFVLDLSYLGWALLSCLPAFVMLAMLYRALFRMLDAGPEAFWNLDPNVLIAQAIVLPMWCWDLIISVFSLVVGVFYIPNQQCVTLGYFETAKRTSGVGLGAEPPRMEGDSGNGWTGGWGQM